MSAGDVPGCPIDVSIVSHGHGALVVSALDALALSLPQSEQLVRVWLTLNLSEPALVMAVQDRVWPFDVQWIHNLQPMGFGANHNQAFARSRECGGGQWFVVMNPDIFWLDKSEGFWLSLLQGRWSPEVGLVCPMQLDVKGDPQDFARTLITPWGVALRSMRRLLLGRAEIRPVTVFEADWINGACMVWRASAFAAVGGFDVRYFMYCEDTDVCLRMQLAGWRMQAGDVSVVHDARRHSGRNWRHLRWHMASLMRLWLSSVFWRFVSHRKQQLRSTA